MAYKQPLNPRQLEVLQWIALGCPDGVMTDSTYKTSAAALKGRRLVTVSKRGGWHVALTDAGRHYVEHGEYPGPSKKTRSPAAQSPKTRKEAPKPSVDSAAQPTHSPEERHDRASSSDAAEAPEPAVPLETQHVLVPDQLRNPHPVVVALRDDKRQFDITQVARHRALRIIQGLIVAAEGEGHVAKTTASSQNRWGHAWDSKDHLVIDTGECRIGVRVHQESDRSAHVPTPYESAQKKRYEWTRIPDWDYTPSERLRIEIGGRSRGRQSNWADRKRWKLEDKLPAILAELRQQHEEAALERVETERQQAERQRQWEAAIETAKIRLRESSRADELVNQAEDWQQANLLREYVESLRSAAGSIADPVQAEAAREWIDWASEYCERVDPRSQCIEMPDDPEPTPDALKPFMGGWSPYGPNGW